MATVPVKEVRWKNGYPTTDGKPMAETDGHRELMNVLIQVLKMYFAAQPLVYVSGNLLIYYIPGNKRKHISPDVFVVKGVPNHERPNYLVWEEGYGPDIVIELTSSSTRREDVASKFRLYQDVLKVKEYFLFDPYEDYLDPSLQGHRLYQGQYRPIRVVNGRLPSRVLGLHLERDGEDLRLYNPATGDWLPTLSEVIAQSEEARQQAEIENERLRREVEELRRLQNGS